MAQCARGGTFMAATPTTTTPTTMMAGTTDGGAATLDDGTMLLGGLLLADLFLFRSFVRLVCRCMWMSFADLAALRWWFPARLRCPRFYQPRLSAVYVLLHRSSGLPARSPEAHSQLLSSTMGKKVARPDPDHEPALQLTAACVERAG